jgi:hypothetical protein
MAYSGIKYINVKGGQQTNLADKMVAGQHGDESLQCYEQKEKNLSNEESEARSIVLSPWKRRFRTYRARALWLTLFFVYTAYVVLSLIHDSSGAIFVCLLEAVFLLIVIFKVFKVDIWEPVATLQMRCVSRVKGPWRKKIRM